MSTNAKKTICVLEHPEHFRKIQERGLFSNSDIIFYCVSGEVEDLLTQEGIAFNSLGENVLCKEWDAINTWAKKASLSWFSIPPFSEVLDIDGLNLGDLVNRPVSHALIYQLKTQLLIDHLLSTVDFDKVFDKVVVFDEFLRCGLTCKKNLGFFNELFLNRIRKESITILKIQCRLKPPEPISLKKILRNILTALVTLLPFKKRSIDFIGMGAIRDIIPLLSRLGLTDSVAFIDEKIHLLTYKNCKDRKIRYVLGDSLVSLAGRLKLYRKVREKLLALKKALPEIPKPVWFYYKDRPVIGVEKVITEVIKQSAFQRVKQKLICQGIFKQMNAKALILHEDLSAFRGAAQATRQLNKPVIVLSHGIPPTNSDFRGLNPNIGVAQMVVNSNFERDKYIKTGYSPQLLHVLGLPRFDLINNRIRRESGVSITDGRTVLYCPHMLRYFSKHKKGYLGIHTPGVVTKKYAIAVMEACQKIGCRLWIKLHDNQDLNHWQKLVKQYGNDETKLFRHHTNIFDLLEKCDLVVTTFSTVVIEAMLFGKNVIAMNFTGAPDIHPYAEHGIAFGVQNPAGLAKGIHDCLFDEGTRARLKENRLKHKRYFGGKFDGKNTNRAVNFVKNIAHSEVRT